MVQQPYIFASSQLVYCSDTYQVPFDVNTSDLEGDLYHISSSDEEEDTGQLQDNQNNEVESDDGEKVKW